MCLSEYGRCHHRTRSHLWDIDIEAARGRACAALAHRDDVPDVDFYGTSSGTVAAVATVAGRSILGEGDDEGAATSAMVRAGETRFAEELRQAENLVAAVLPKARIEIIVSPRPARPAPGRLPQISAPYTAVLVVDGYQIFGSPAFVVDAAARSAILAAQAIVEPSVAA